jgi:hypothetical protein
LIDPEKEYTVVVINGQETNVPKGEGVWVSPNMYLTPEHIEELCVIKKGKSKDVIRRGFE